MQIKSFSFYIFKNIMHSLKVKILNKKVKGNNINKSTRFCRNFEKQGSDFVEIRKTGKSFCRKSTSFC